MGLDPGPAETRTQGPAGGRLVAIDVLRAVAALMVVVTHTRRPVPTGADLNLALALPFDFGVLGVAMFIVISGFCIHLGYARRLAVGDTAGWSWRRFWARRFYRLYPPYLAAIGLSLAVVYGLAATTGRPTGLPPGTGWDLGTHLLMVHNLTEAYAFGLGNGPFWSLGLEEQLYGLFAVVVLLRTRVRAGTVLKVGLAVSVAWWVAVAWAPVLLAHPGGVRLGPVALGTWGAWPFGYWFMWLLGAYAAEVYVGLARPPRWAVSGWAIALALAVVAVTHDRTLGRYVRFWMTDDGTGVRRAALLTVVYLSDSVFAFACFGLLLRLIAREQAGGMISRPARWLAGVGLFSYSLYLTHIPVLNLVHDAVGPPETLAGVPLRAALDVVAAVGFAALFFLAVERRFLAVGGRRRTEVTGFGPGAAAGVLGGLPAVRR